MTIDIRRKRRRRFLDDFGAVAAPEGVGHMRVDRRRRSLSNHRAPAVYSVEDHVPVERSRLKPSIRAARLYQQPEAAAVGSKPEGNTSQAIELGPGVAGPTKGSVRKDTELSAPNATSGEAVRPTVRRKLSTARPSALVVHSAPRSRSPPIPIVRPANAMPSTIQITRSGLTSGERLRRLIAGQVYDGPHTISNVVGEAIPVVERGTNEQPVSDDCETMDNEADQTLDVVVNLMSQGHYKSNLPAEKETVRKNATMEQVAARVEHAQEPQPASHPASTIPAALPAPPVMSAAAPQGLASARVAELPSHPAPPATSMTAPRSTPPSGGAMRKGRLGEAAGEKQNNLLERERAIRESWRKSRLEHLQALVLIEMEREESARRSREELEREIHEIEKAAVTSPGVGSG